jgi:hypothetical protein
MGFRKRVCCGEMFTFTMSMEMRLKEYATIQSDGLTGNIHPGTMTEETWQKKESLIWTETL